MECGNRVSKGAGFTIRVALRTSGRGAREETEMEMAWRCRWHVRQLIFRGLKETMTVEVSRDQLKFRTNREYHLAND